MAYGDYQHCAKCDAKTFYDARVDWASMYVPNDGYLPNEDAIKSLCEDCAKTHEVVCVERGELDRLRNALASENALVKKVVAETAGERHGLLCLQAELYTSLAAMVAALEHEGRSGDGIADEHFAAYEAAKSALVRCKPGAPVANALAEMADTRERASHVPGMSAELDALRAAQPSAQELEALRVLRELRESPHRESTTGTITAARMSVELRGGHQPAATAPRALAALLAPDEVNRG